MSDPSTATTSGAPAATTATNPRLLLSFVALVTIQTLSQLLFKAAQVGNQYTFNPAGQMVLAELVKLFISLAMVLRTERGGTLKGKGGGGGSGLMVIYRMPLFLRMGYFFLAAAYAANNQLTFVILRMANPGLLSLAKSSTPLLIAACSAIVFNERLSRLQWQCVVLLVCGLVTIFASRSSSSSGGVGGGDSIGSTDIGSIGSGGEESGSALSAITPSAGVLIVFACALTAGSSALNAHLLHLKGNASSPSSSVSSSASSSSDGESGFRNIWVQNALLYSYGAAANMVLFVVGLTPSAEVGFFSGYSESPMAVLLLLSNALVGLLVTFVYRRGNAVVKTIATSVSSALLLLLPALRALAVGGGGVGGGTIVGGVGLGPDTTGGAAPAEDEGPDEVGDFQQQLHTLMGCVVILTAALIYLEHPNQLSK
jgi:hypothetical protein